MCVKIGWEVGYSVASENDQYFNLVEQSNLASTYLIGTLNAGTTSARAKFGDTAICDRFYR